MRALRRDANGEVDESLVPKAIRDWYVGSEDEQDTVSECDSDCEWEWVFCGDENICFFDFFAFWPKIVWSMGKMGLYIWYSIIGGKSKSTEISMTVEISDQKNLGIIGGLVGLFETGFGSFISARIVSESAADLG